MKRLPLAVICLFLCAVFSCAAITLDEIADMLRSGVSSREIIQEHLNDDVYGTFNARREEEFKRLHASPELLNELQRRAVLATERREAAALIAQIKSEASNRPEPLQEPEAVKIERQRILKEAAEQQALAERERARQNQKIVVVPAQADPGFKLPSEIEAEKRAAKLAQIAARQKYCEEHPVECETLAAAQQARSDAQQAQSDLESLKTQLWFEGVNR